MAGEEEEQNEGGEQEPALKQPDRDKIYLNHEHLLQDMKAASGLS